MLQTGSNQHGEKYQEGRLWIGGGGGGQGRFSEEDLKNEINLDRMGWRAEGTVT